MGNLLVSDNAATTLAASISNSPYVSSITVTNGAKFPVVNHGGTGTDWSYVTLFDAAGNIETMKVTRHDNGSGSMSVVRGTAAGISGVNDASCLAWGSGTTGVACRLISQTVIDLFSALDLKANAASPSTTGTLTHSGDIVLSGSGKRITGDFSNATVADRVLFQTSTANGNTVLHAIPNGTGSVVALQAINSSNLTDHSFANLQASSSEVAVQSGVCGTGTYLPMTFYTGGSERVRIGTNGNVGVGRSPTCTLDIYRASGSAHALVTSNGATGADIAYLSASANSGTYTTQMAQYGGGTSYVSSTGTHLILQITGNYPISFNSNGAQQMRLDPTAGLTITRPTGLGYGMGAGGTVTQATSKSTAVTLNKPTGQITMNNAALAAGASATFSVINSIVANSDSVSVSSPFSNSDSYRIECSKCAGGLFNIRVTNITGGSLSEAIVINFNVFKGATA